MIIHNARIFVPGLVIGTSSAVRRLNGKPFSPKLHHVESVSIGLCSTLQQRIVDIFPYPSFTGWTFTIHMNLNFGKDRNRAETGPAEKSCHLFLVSIQVSMSTKSASSGAMGPSVAQKRPLPADGDVSLSYLPRVLLIISPIHSARLLNTLR